MSDHDAVEQVITTAWRAHVVIEDLSPPSEVGHPVVAFVTLVSATTPLVNAPPELKRLLKHDSTIPTLLLARMGVDKGHQRKRLGEFLLMYALGSAHHISQLSGCSAVFVDAKNDSVKAFYEKYGFLAIEPHSLRLYMLAETIRMLNP